MKLENANYCATIVKVDETHSLSGCDNLVGIGLFGYNVIAHKNINLDELQIMFTTETQLNELYLSKNNLYSSANMNDDIKIKGYIGKNGRVKAIRLRGHPSNAMLMPLTSLKGLGINIKALKEGDEFNIIEGKELCKKFVPKANASVTGSNKIKGQTKKYERIDGLHFPEHFSTEQWGRNEFKYDDEDILIVTQKLHGTSVRFGHVNTRIKPTLIDRVLGRQRMKYDHLAGSRRVIKDLKSDKVFKHFYETVGNKDIYNRALEDVKNVIPKDVMIYGELVGYNGGSAIQKGYTYGEEEGSFSLYVYRITSINTDGQAIDWGWDAVREFCSVNNLKHVPELERVKKEKFKLTKYIDKNYSKLRKTVDTVIPVDKGMVDEGVCIRREGLRPFVTKAKSPMFYEWETKLLDGGENILS